ncbi:hypothetical protein LEP1GSC068_3213 [Leptospira sp. Fiocruz LV3954]|nr:hypothetical protein LEP1GSC068_3213 [Leptospira sp. Fiocruz LV3954]EMI67889.1 hypothetical protein LEP1GSC076_1902 [Leptospira sp. Fiocruz LV4135]
MNFHLIIAVANGDFIREFDFKIVVFGFYRGAPLMIGTYKNGTK